MLITEPCRSKRPAAGAGADTAVRQQVAIVIGILSAIACFLLLARHQLGAGDFTWVVRGARLWLQGIDPYKATGYPNGMPLFYPMPALFLALLLTPLPDMLAGSLFFGLSSGLLAWALYPERRHQMMVFLATPFWGSALLAQWSPLMMAACLLPWLGFLVACKPNLGLLALTQYRPPAWTMAVAAAAVALSLLLLPAWPAQWWANTSRYTPAATMLPFMRLLLPLAFLRWRRPEARILGLLAFVPHQSYDLMLLWLMPRTFRQSLVLTLLSWLAYVVWLGNKEISSWLSSGLFYLPALLCVLLPQKSDKPGDAALSPA